jgi:hypothetical protein
VISVIQTSFPLLGWAGNGIYSLSFHELSLLGSSPLIVLN